MNIRRIKVSEEYLYYYFFFLMMLNNWCGDLQVLSLIYEKVKPLILLSSIMLITLLIFKEKYSFRELICISFLILMGMYTSYKSGSMWILYSMLLISLVKCADINKLTNIAYKSMSVFLIIALSLFGIQVMLFPNTVTVYNDGTVIKYSMTFIGANEAARYWIYWTLLFICLYYKKRISLLKKLLIFLGTIFFYICTRSDALLLVIIIIFMKYMGKSTHWVKFVRKYSGYTFPLLWSGSLLLLTLNGTWIFNWIDNFFSGRLFLGIKSFNKYGVTLIGRTTLEFFKWITNDTVPAYRLVLDNAFYMVMVQYGIIYLFLLSFIFIKSSKKCSYPMSICIIVYSLFALAENTIFSPTAIFPVLIAAHACWNKKVGMKGYVN